MAHLRCDFFSPAPSTPTAPAMWVGCGTEDALYADNVRFVQACASAGVPVTSSFTEGGHEWGLWDQQIQEVLAWLPL